MPSSIYGLKFILCRNKLMCLSFSVTSILSLQTWLTSFGVTNLLAYCGPELMETRTFKMLTFVGILKTLFMWDFCWSKWMSILKRGLLFHRFWIFYIHWSLRLLFPCTGVHSMLLHYGEKKFSSTGPLLFNPLNQKSFSTKTVLHFRS